MIDIKVILTFSLCQIKNYIEEIDETNTGNNSREDTCQFEPYLK